MTKRYKSQKRADVFAVAEYESRLPTDRPIAVYYRQSSDAQIGNVSTTIQTVDMVEYLKHRRWAEKDIIMIDMDAGISGSTKIDERPGMSMLFDLITQGEIGAVACQDEDRLFRDVTQIQVNIFIEACRQSQVLVLTPSMVYDFANELTGTFHARQFRFKSEMAAEYINSVIRGKLHRAKRHLLMEGRWTGAGVPVGFLVDMRKTLPDGCKNENWRRYVPFEPYAEVVNEYYRLFLSNAGNLRATIRHIHEHGPYYPDPETCRPPEGFKAAYRMWRHGRGFCPGKSGLVKLLTNVAYIGHWAVNDVIVRWDNHPAIVPVDVFMSAFNCLSDVRPDGSPNKSYRPYRPQTRPSLDEKRPVERPLCAGMIVSEYSGEWRNVGTVWLGSLQRYSYILLAPDTNNSHVWSKAASFVDEMVVELLRAKLTATFDMGVWQQTLTEFARQYDKERQRKGSQLKALEQVMENLVTSLEALSNPLMVTRVEERYEAAQAEYARLKAEIAATESEAARLEVVENLKETCGPALANWSTMTRDERISVLRAFIERIEATPVERNGLRLLIRWRDGSTDECVLPRQSTTGRQWLPSETERLLTIIDAGASQVEISATFPHRTWGHIRNRVYSIRGKGVPRLSTKPIRDYETYQMYQERTARGIPTHQARTGEPWSEEEDQRLLDLLDRGVTRLELAEALPRRSWGGIRTRIREIRGKNVPVAGRGSIMRHETIAAYNARIAQEATDGIGEAAPEIMDSATYSSTHGRAPGTGGQARG